jgi:hypothetical protein
MMTSRRPDPFLPILTVVVMLVAMAVLLAGCDKQEEQPAAATSTSVAATTTVVTTPTKSLAAGEIWEITETTRLSSLTVGEGATVKAPEGKSVTLTVDGVETGQKLVSTDAYDLMFVPGTYTGDVVLTVADANPVEYLPPGPSATPVVAPVRQAIFIDESGFSEAKSVLAAVVGETPGPQSAEDVLITSTGECFNGVWAQGSYTLQDIEIDLTGNARSDFSGYGAAVVTSGPNT